MLATDTLRDIWAHHAWADAEHWRALEAWPSAFEDAALFTRLHGQVFVAERDGVTVGFAASYHARTERRN